MHRHSADMKKRGRSGRLRVFGRRGMEDKIMFLIWEVIAIAMVSLVLIMAVKGVANNTTYWKKYHSADLAMTTDLALTNQGDFRINYNLKELHSKVLTNIIGINKPAFQIFLKDGSYQLYSISTGEDRFPQSFIFASNHDVKVVESNANKDYIILQKSQDTFSMDAGKVVISCPISDTSVSLESAKFYALSLDTAMSSYSNYVNTVLDVYGKTDEKKEFLIGIMTDKNSGGQSTIYYNPDDTTGSSKMACLLRKYISEKYPDMKIEDKVYDDSFILGPQFEDSSKEYSHWIIIKIGKESDASDTLAITDKDMGECMENAVKEYYGKK